MLSGCRSHKCLERKRKVNALDVTLTDGRLNPKVPYLKAELLKILPAGYPDQRVVSQAVGGLSDGYRADYPDVAAQHGPDIDKPA